MTKKENRPVWTRVIGFVALALMLKGCATGSAIPAQPQNPSVNAAATARG